MGTSGKKGEWAWTDEQKAAQRERVKESWRKRRAGGVVPDPPGGGGNGDRIPLGGGDGNPSGASAEKSVSGPNLLGENETVKGDPPKIDTPQEPLKTSKVDGNVLKRGLPGLLKKINRVVNKVLTWISSSSKIRVKITLDPLPPDEAALDAEIMYPAAEASLPGFIQRHPILMFFFMWVLDLISKLNFEKKVEVLEDGTKRQTAGAAPGAAASAAPGAGASQVNRFR